MKGWMSREAVPDSDGRDRQAGVEGMCRPYLGRGAFVPGERDEL